MKAHFLLMAAAVFTAAAVFSQVSSHAPPNTSSTAQQLTTLLTANGLKADVSFLASDLLEGRDTPSRGLDLAAEYIAAQYRRAGLEPVGDDGYFQTANFVSVTPNTDGLDFTLQTAASPLKANTASISLQEPVALNLDHAAVVKVAMEDQAAIDALTPEQVRGKVLVLEPSAPSSPSQPAAAGRGGRGGAGIATALAGKLQPAAIVLFSAPGGRGGGGAGGRGARLREASTITAAAAAILSISDPAIRTALDTAAAPTISAHIAAPTVVPSKVRNVIGLLRGSDAALKDTYVLITAHYDHLGIRDNGTPDHIFNGANDDGSGTASVIEIANALAALPTRPARSIVFMTQFGEEKGDLGSRYYVQHPIFPLAKTIVDVNLEQVGRTDDLEGPRVGAFNLTGFDYTDLPAVFRRAGQQTDIQVIKHEKNSDAYFTRSDNAAFAEAGIPATTLSVAYDYPDYHKAGDEWPKLDYENMAKVDRTVALAALDIANNPQAPKWDASNPKTERFVKARSK
jgi:Peptidase family M28